MEYQNIYCLDIFIYLSLSPSYSPSSAASLLFSELFVSVASADTADLASTTTVEVNLEGDRRTHLTLESIF